MSVSLDMDPILGFVGPSGRLMGCVANSAGSSTFSLGLLLAASSTGSGAGRRTGREMRRSMGGMCVFRVQRKRYVRSTRMRTNTR